MNVDAAKNTQRPPLSFASLSGWVSLVSMLALLTLAKLSGCAETEPDSLHSWLQSERARHQLQRPSSAPEAEALSDAGAAELPRQVAAHLQVVEPFNSLRLLHKVTLDGSPMVQKNAPQNSALGSPPSRLTPPLEATPLVAMRLVGSLQKGAQPLALLRVKGLIYLVRVGDRLGQDQGRVTAITLSELVLQENALDAAGQPMQRSVSLALVSEP